MILRIRTNLGMIKITIDEKENFLTLQKSIVEKLNISNLKKMILTRDLNGEYPVIRSSRDMERSLTELGLKHGDELFIVGKFKEIIVEKSYINDDHELIQAGKSLRLIEEQSVKEEGEPAKNDGKAGAEQKKKEEEIPLKSERREEYIQRTVSPPMKSDGSGVSSTFRDTVPVSSSYSSSSFNQPVPSSFNPHHPTPFIPDEDDDIRRPDEVQRMTLLEPSHSPSREFTPQVSLCFRSWLS
jgi:hypothetical protein